MFIKELIRWSKNMEKNLKNTLLDFENFFNSKPTTNQKVCGIINDFFNLVLTYMEENNISKVSLSKKLNISRSAVSQLLNGKPNITLKKMVEISEAIGFEFEIIPKYINSNITLSSKENINEYYITGSYNKVTLNKKNINIIKTNNNSELLFYQQTFQI